MALLCVPSYVIPGTYLENIRFIDSLEAVHGIELLFFSYDRETRRLLKNELSGIREYAGRFRFTVHMPDRLEDDHRELIDTLRGLAAAFVVHVPQDEPEAFAERIQTWSTEYGQVFRIENVAGRSIDYGSFGLDAAPLCCDTGHLLLDGIRPRAFFEELGARVEEVHLHTAVHGKDHRPITGGEQWFTEAVPFLRRFEGDMVVEIFDIGQIMPMVDVLRRSEVVTDE